MSPESSGLHWEDAYSNWPMRLMIFDLCVDWLPSGGWREKLSGLKKSAIISYGLDNSCTTWYIYQEEVTP